MLKFPTRVPSYPHALSVTLSLPVRSLVCTFFLAALCLGCEQGTGTPPEDVTTGTFTAVVSGSVVDTLTGDASARIEGQMLVGLEMDVDSLRGISVELEPRAPERRIYEVIDAELMGTERESDAGEMPGMVVFLDARRGTFQSVAGSLSVTYQSPSEIGGTFDVEMEGTFDGVPGATPSLRVRGSVRAALPSGV